MEMTTMIFDPVYLLFLLPGLLLSLCASFRVRTAYGKYSQVASINGYTGKETAEILLVRAGIHDVQVIPTHGYLPDQYNPVNKHLALSEENYGGRSIAAIGVAT